MGSLCCVAETARVGENTVLGPYCVVGENAEIGHGCRIGAHVVIYPGTRIGNEVRIDDNTVVGKPPMRAKRSIFRTEESFDPAVIGNHCLIGAQVVIYCGCSLGEHVLVADHAAIREEVSIGGYTIVGRGVTVENKSRVGRKCKLETNCYIAAYSSIDDYCFVAPMVTTTNDNFMGRSEERFKHFKGITMKRGARIGANTTVLPGRTIGEDSMVSAGSVVTRNVPDGKLVIGCPARKLGDVPEDQKLHNQGWD